MRDIDWEKLNKVLSSVCNSYDENSFSHLRPREDSKVDMKNFDWEWERQSQLVADYSAAVAIADKIVRKIASMLDIYKSQKHKDIRKNPEKYGFEPDKVPADNAIKAFLPSLRGVRLLEDSHSDAIANKKILEGQCRALDHKKRSLEAIGDRIAKQLYSEPRLSKEARNTKRQMRKEEVRQERQNRHINHQKYSKQEAEYGNK